MPLVRIAHGVETLGFFFFFFMTNFIIIAKPYTVKETCIFYIKIMFVYKSYKILLCDFA